MNMCITWFIEPLSGGPVGLAAHEPAVGRDLHRHVPPGVNFMNNHFMQKVSLAVIIQQVYLKQLGMDNNVTYAYICM
jgi:hypothetical protein